MTSIDKKGNEANSADETDSGLEDDIQASQHLDAELAFLFGEDIVEQSNHIDIVDLNLNQAITESIASGVKQLKALKSTPQAQQKFVDSLAAGEQIVLCMWIREMQLLNKIQDLSYFSH